MGEAIEVTSIAKVVLRPDAFERFDELLRAAVTLIVFEPRLADRRELVFEPAADDVDPDAATRDVIDRGQLLGYHRRAPRARENSRKYLEFRRGMQQRLAERDRF